MSEKKYQIPRCADGSIPGYASRLSSCTWSDPEAFYTTLRLLGTYRGRSAAGYVFDDVLTGGAQYEVGLVAALDVFSSSRFSGGQITAWFMPYKQGTHYGVRMASDEEVMEACLKRNKQPT